jgi:hypothetical protein
MRRINKKTLNKTPRPFIQMGKAMHQTKVKLLILQAMAHL